MKKSLLALAVFGAFAGVASAQSSVTVYGRVDTAFVYEKLKSGAVTPAANPSTSRFSLESGYYAGSRLGFKGSEDLGGGLAAFFQLENGFNSDSGSLGQGGRIFGRVAQVGFNGGFGTFAVGRFGTPSSNTGPYDVWSVVDPLEAAYGIAGFQSTFATESQRASNSILYRTPDLAGFQGTFQYSLASSFGGSDTEAAGGTTRNPTSIDIGLKYGAGPVYVALTYDRYNNLVAPKPLTTDFADETVIQLGGWYDLGVLKLHAAIAKEKNANTGIVSPLSGAVGFGVGLANNAYVGDSTDWMVGTSVPIGAGTFFASYAVHNGKSFATSATTTSEFDRRVIGLGYKYALSKRTQLHVAYGDSDGKKSANNVGALDSRQLGAGISHTF
jgi:predicted porin